VLHVCVSYSFTYLLITLLKYELMFLLHKNPDTPRWGDPELAPVGRFF
jgi:hypothetical protein